jgi:hypothetical protein
LSVVQIPAIPGPQSSQVTRTLARSESAMPRHDVAARAMRSNVTTLAGVRCGGDALAPSPMVRWILTLSRPRAAVFAATKPTIHEGSIRSIEPCSSVTFIAANVQQVSKPSNVFVWVHGHALLFCIVLCYTKEVAWINRLLTSY